MDLSTSQSSEGTMKSLTWLWRCMLTDVSIRCATDTHRDLVTGLRRIKCEGDSFLTITLPSFCSDFEKSLSLGMVDPTLFLSFKKRAALPVFLQGLLGQIFDPLTGKLLGCPSIDAILSVRQLCLMFKKVNLPCSTTRTRRSINAYIQVESELAGIAASIHESTLYVDFRHLSAIQWAGCLGRMHNSISVFGHKPAHGPGTTAERIRGNGKFRAWHTPLQISERKREDGTIPSSWHWRLEEHFPFIDFGLTGPSSMYLRDSLLETTTQFADPDAEMPVRVVTVPKTLKGPRIIAIEPLCMQFAQQALLGLFVDTIQNHGVSAGHVNFSDQTINQRLALGSSSSGEFATLDLSDASDRVLLDLVDGMLNCAPLVRDAVMACRSSRADLPTGETITLRKFASMGSALCFPIEAMAFFTIATLAGLKALGLPVTSRNARRVSSRIYVYGDDIIVPVDQVESTVHCLEALGLKVSGRKSFWAGKFRESCGVDAYDGVDVTPVYVRRGLPNNRQDTPEIVSSVSLANQLYLKGWWGTARRVREAVESITGELPHVLDTSPGLGWTSIRHCYSIQRWSNEWHRFEVRTATIHSAKFTDTLTGTGALQKFFLKNGNKPILGEHLERSVRPDSARIKYRWVPPY